MVKPFELIFQLIRLLQTNKKNNTNAFFDAEMGLEFRAKWTELSSGTVDYALVKQNFKFWLHSIQQI